MVVSVIMFNVHNWKGVYMSSGMFGYVDVLKTAADASWAREDKILFRFQTKDFDGVWVAVTKQLDQLSEGINGRIGFYMAYLLKISSGQDFAFAVYGTAPRTSRSEFSVFVPYA